VQPVAITTGDTPRIQRAIDLSMGLEQAPSNLTPTIDQANADRPASNNDGCHAEFLVVEQPSCVYGDPSGDNGLVLFGDSHAQQWEPALDTMGKRLGWQVQSLTKSSCPIADVTLYEEHIKRPYTECATWRERTLERIERARPDVVVLSQSDDVPGQQLSDQQWAAATVDTVRRLRAAGIRVAYLMDTPVPGTNGPECVADNLDDVTACARPRDRAYTDAGRHQTMAAALHSARARVVEPVDWFCGTEWCPLVIGNLLVYRDRSHMSTAYSRWLTPMLRPLFVARG
jgi:SGNH domain (fused to AT3 domains)